VNEQPPETKKTLLSWSGGKDSAWALHLLRRNPHYRVEALLTTTNHRFGRVAIHGFREDLLDRQAQAVGLPVWKVPLPYPCTNAEYESRMGEACERATRKGFEAVAFGDLFLEDVREYRVSRLAGSGLEPVFPLWGLPTSPLALEMVAAGLRARITCIDPRSLPEAFCGRVFDGDFLADLPAAVDPCGERGEFHTFAFAGPMFSAPIPVRHSHNVVREGFIYGELLSRDARNAEAVDSGLVREL
jgi:uncharacterized protein (TIGR00290 family)